MRAAPGVEREDVVWQGGQCAGSVYWHASPVYGNCARCWNLREGVGHNGAYPDLCPRCVQAVEEMKAG